MDVLERVLESNTATAAPLHFQHETSGSETKGMYSCRIQLVNTATAAPTGTLKKQI